MKKINVKVGETYVAKISGRLVPVRLEAVSPYGGWNARNLATRREVRIRSAAKLRRPVAEQTTSAIARLHAGQPVGVKDRTGDDAHRAAHPEQYARPLVGRRVTFAYDGQTRAGTVLRVIATRFGSLAAIDSIPATEAIAVTALTVT